MTPGALYPGLYAGRTKDWKAWRRALSEEQKEAIRADARQAHALRRDENRAYGRRYAEQRQDPEFIARKRASSRAAMRRYRARMSPAQREADRIKGKERWRQYEARCNAGMPILLVLVVLLRLGWPWPAPVPVSMARASRHRERPFIEPARWVRPETRDEIAVAMAEFLARGGKIRRLGSEAPPSLKQWAYPRRSYVFDDLE